MKNVWRLFLLLEILLFSGCVDEQGRSGAYGGISLHLSTNSTVTDVTTRSGQEEKLPSVQDFSISVLQGDKVQASWDKLADYDEDTTYPVGNYTLKASYGDIEKEGFESPYYEGAVDFEILGGKTTPVEATCRLANTKMSIEYTDDFKEYFKTYSSAIKAEQGNEVTFTSEETRSAYVKPGRVSVKVTFTKVSGGFGSTTVEVATVDALPQHHYHLLMDVDAGKAMLSIVFDRVTEEKPITLDISDKALNIKPPYFTLTGFEKTSDDNNQWDGNLIESSKLSALLTSLGGFKKCILRTTSPNLLNSATIKWPEEGFELANLNEVQRQLIAKSGIKLIGFGENKSEMAIIDFTGVVPHLSVTDDNNTHLFYLEITSTYGKQSEEYVLNITTPKTFMLLPANLVKMGATEVVLPVKLKEGVPTDVELYYKNYGSWNRITDFIFKEMEGKAGYYNFTAKGVSFGFVAKEFMAIYHEMKSTIVKVGVLVPEYKIVLEDTNMFATKAVMVVEADNAEDKANVIRAMDVQILKDGKWISAEKIEKKESSVIVKGLLANTNYQFRTTCDEGRTFVEGINGQTEFAILITNGDFSSWASEVTYSGIPQGGRTSYWDNGIFGLGAKAKWSDAPTANISYKEPTDWTTSNKETVSANPTVKNTWYQVPSAMSFSESGRSGVTLRSVAWNDEGQKISDNTAATKNGGGNIPIPPTNFKRSAGKVFIGDSYEKGFPFTSRPTSVRITYKYVPLKGADSDGGTLNIKVKNNTIVIGEGKANLTSLSWDTVDVPIDYVNNLRLKATSLHLMLTSSAKYWTGGENSIITVNNTQDYISVGSEINIDKVELNYD